MQGFAKKVAFAGLKGTIANSKIRTEGTIASWGLPHENNSISF